VKKFQFQSKEAEKIKYGTSLSDLITETGYADVKLTSSIEDFSAKMIDYVDSYEILYEEII
jgi:hypothetical protein